jgi:hypothetical protein
VDRGVRAAISRGDGEPAFRGAGSACRARSARQDTVGRGPGPGPGAARLPIPESVVSATRQPTVGRGRHGAASGPVAARRSRASRVRWWRRTGDVRIDVHTMRSAAIVVPGRSSEMPVWSTPRSPARPAPSDRVVTPAGRARRCTNGPAGSRPARGHGTDGGGAPPTPRRRVGGERGRCGDQTARPPPLLGTRPVRLTRPILLSGARRTLRRAVHVPAEILSTGHRVAVAMCDPAARTSTTRPGGSWVDHVDGGDADGRLTRSVGGLPEDGAPEPRRQLP